MTCGVLLCVVLGLRARRWMEDSLLGEVSVKRFRHLITEQYLEQFLVHLEKVCTGPLAASNTQEDQVLRPRNDPDMLSRLQPAWLRSLPRWTPTSASRSARPSRASPGTRIRGLGGLHSDSDGSLDIEEIWKHWGRHHGVSKHHMLQFISEHASSSEGRRRFLLRSDNEGRTWVSVTQSLRHFTTRRRRRRGGPDASRTLATDPRGCDGDVLSISSGYSLKDDSTIAFQHPVRRYGGSEI